MKARTIVTVATILLMGIASPAGAQLGEDERRVIEAVLRHRMVQVADGDYGLRPSPRLALDPRLLLEADRSEPVAAGDPRPDLLSGIAAALGLETARQEDVYHCGSRNPQSCRLDGVDMLLTVGMPEVDGGRATVTVSQLTFVPADAARQPVHLGGQVLELEKREGEWRVVRVVSMWTT